MSASIGKVSVCVLNQWALDFKGNKDRIISSIIKAKNQGATYRAGPELEISGYGCADHFLEGDTFQHSWEVLCEILKNSECYSILCDIGMPVRHKNVAYNCRVIVLNGQILLIRPKMHLADDGNYREGRWFCKWSKRKQVEDCVLPECVSAVTGQKTVPFGDALLQLDDTCIGIETCEEVWNVASSHIDQSLDGAEVFVNGSGSYHELRKLGDRLDMIRSATRKAGGVYMYSNLRGCDGERVYYDGCSMVVVNGDVVAHSEQFGLADVEVVTAAVDLDEIRSYRQACQSFCQHAAGAEKFPRVQVPWKLCSNECYSPNEVMQLHEYTPEEEISLGPACWLWDYLRRSGQGGYLLPLSGGIDSSASACIVHSMCRLVCSAVQQGDAQVLKDCRRIVCDETYMPQEPRELCHRLLTTVYMGTENSSVETRRRAAQLSEQLGANHLTAAIDTAIAAMLTVLSLCLGAAVPKPKFKVHGGSLAENIALQNLQARLRMVLAYLLAQLSQWARGRSGTLLVLGSANLDEGLRGYLTKYDCSSADVNPIGGLSKTDLRSFVAYCAKNWGCPALDAVYTAPPTAELEPLKQDGEIAQTDEVDMGMTYDELSVFGRLRKIGRCGPVSMFKRLMPRWGSQHGLSPREVADKVQHFFRCYSINRHKMTVITPAYHAEKYGMDDNRYDLRQFLYPVDWSWQFVKMEELVATEMSSVRGKWSSGKSQLAGRVPGGAGSIGGRAAADMDTTRDSSNSGGVRGHDMRLLKRLIVSSSGTATASKQAVKSQTPSQSQLKTKRRRPLSARNSSAAASGGGGRTSEVKSNNHSSQKECRTVVDGLALSPGAAVIKDKQWSGDVEDSSSSHQVVDKEKRCFAVVREVAVRRFDK